MLVNKCSWHICQCSYISRILEQWGLFILFLCCCDMQIVSTDIFYLIYKVQIYLAVCLTNTL